MDGSDNRQRQESRIPVMTASKLASLAASEPLEGHLNVQISQVCSTNALV